MHGRAGARPTQRAAASGLRPAAPLPFVVVLDVTIVTTALPAIRQGLEFTDNELQWVFTRVRAGLRRTADLRRPRGRCSGSTTNFPHRSRAVLGRVCGLRPRVVARNSRGRPGTAGCRSGPALARCTGRAHDAQPAWRSAAACCGLVDRSRGRWWGQRLGARRVHHRIRRMALGVCGERPDRAGRADDYCRCYCLPTSNRPSAGGWISAAP